MFFNKKLKLQLKESTEKIIELENQITELNKLLDCYRLTSKAKALIEDVRKECITKDDFYRLSILEKSINDINYRTYITKTKSGRICLDIQQIPLIRENIKP